MIDECSNEYTELYPYARKCHSQEHFLNLRRNVCGQFRVRNSDYDLELHDVCPSETSEADCEEQNKFYCKYSKSCISHSKTCDGIVHCGGNGEDEDFSLCHNPLKSTFPETATIECLEKGRGKYEIKILAIPCNGEEECIDGIDEKYCEQGSIGSIISLAIALALILILCLFVHFSTTKKYPNTISYIPQKITEEIAKYRMGLKGDSLAQLKVNIFYTISKFTYSYSYQKI